MRWSLGQKNFILHLEANWEMDYIGTRKPIVRWVHKNLKAFQALRLIVDLFLYLPDMFGW